MSYYNYINHSWFIICFLIFSLPVRAAESQDSLRSVDLPEVVATGTRSEADPRPYHYSQTDVTGIPAQLPNIDVRIRHYE